MTFFTAKYVLHNNAKYGKIEPKGSVFMNKIDTKFITRTAIILALTIVFQNLRYLIGNTLPSTIIIGSLVNLCIVVATGLVGITAGVVISIISPLIALAQGHLPHPLFVPVTMAGNLVIAIVYYYISKANLAGKASGYVGVVVGALAKWGIMYYVGVALVLNLIIGSALPQQKATLIALSFNVPQFITAIIGGILGVALVGILKNRIDK